LLIFWMTRRNADERRPERWLQNLVKESRNAFLSEVADRINDVIATEQPASDVSDIRMADFAFMLKWIASAMSKRAGENSIANDIDQIIGKIRRSQQQFAGEENVLVLAIKEWVLGSKFEEMNHHRTVLAADLNTELEKIAIDDLKMRWFYKPTTLTKNINQLTPILESELVVETGIKLKTGNGIRIRMKSQSPPQSEFEETRVL